jgi:putative aldouronate transport system permease protein
MKGTKNGDVVRRSAAMKVLARDVSRDKQLYLLLLPFLVYFILFKYKPMYGLLIAFKDYSVFKGMSKSPWVGFEHFTVLFRSPYLIRIVRNTFLISIYSLIFGFPAPIVLALLLNSVKNGLFRKTVQTCTFLPHFVSVVVVAGLVTNFLAPTNGLVNLALEKLGFEKTYFLTKPEFFRPILIAMGIWKETGFASIVYLASLSAIDPQLYEAAYMDGAGSWRRLTHITIPGILPTIMVLLVLRLGTLLNVGYETIILLYQPATYETADVINTYVFRSGLTEGKYDLAAAVGLMNSVVALILVSVSNYVSKRGTEYGVW